MRRLAAVAVGGAVATLAAPAHAAPLSPALARTLEAARAPVAQLEQTTVRTSFGTRFYRFRQEVRGIPVLGAETVVTDAPGSRADLFVDRTYARVATPEPATVASGRAVSSARRAAGVTRLREPARAELAILPDGGRGTLVWRVLLPAESPLASFEILVDARSGKVRRMRDLLRRENGAALVFDPNPVTRQGSRAGLSDADDADLPQFQPLYTPVTLPRLDPTTTCLRGQWVHAVLESGEACAPGRDFAGVRRDDDRFEAVMAYFHIDRAQAYIQSLGFTNVVNRPIRANANGEASDDSFYDPTTRELTFGIGGVDDAEDADVIMHEYGHAIQEGQVPGFAGGAVGEGFGDYLAAAMAATFTPNVVFDPCVGEWDKLGAGDPAPVPCLRRTDRDRTASQVGPGTGCDAEIHCAGEAWSGALWDIRAALGGPAADRVILQSHFSLPRSAGFHEASVALLVADRALNGGANEAFLQNLLASRELLLTERLDDDVVGARPLAVPGSASGELDVGRDVHDVYRIDLVAGQPVSVRMTVAGGGGFDLVLYRPGTTTVADAGAIVRTAATAGATELLTYLPPTTGTYYLDVVAGSGTGAYTLQAFPDADGDGAADGADNCVSVPNPDQSDWNRNRRGDACDPSSLATIERVTVRRRIVTVTGTLRPTALAASAWQLVVRRGSRVVVRVAGRARGAGRVVATVRGLRPGRYQLQALVRDRRYAAARSRTVAIRVR